MTPLLIIISTCTNDYYLLLHVPNCHSWAMSIQEPHWVCVVRSSFQPSTFTDCGPIKRWIANSPRDKTAKQHSTPTTRKVSLQKSRSIDFFFVAVVLSADGLLSCFVNYLYSVFTRAHNLPSTLSRTFVVKYKYTDDCHRAWILTKHDVPPYV